MLKNITLSAEGQLIEKARQRAKVERKTLNAIFREWLKRYALPGQASQYENLMKRVRYVSSGGKFSRKEMNER